VSQLALARWIPPSLRSRTEERPKPPSASPNAKVPCVVVLDDSTSMHGEPIAQLNAGVAEFARALKSDRLAAADIEIAVVTIGCEAKVAAPFTPVSAFEPPVLTARGGTPLGQGLALGLRLLHERQQVYREHDLDAHKPCLLLLTDGAETVSPAEFQKAGTVIKALQQRGLIRFYPVGVDGADMAALGTLTTGDPYRLRGLNFQALFAWLGRSLRSVSRSQPGDDFEPDDPRDCGIAD
jgi:uncharacterized protein YegL